MIPIYSLITDHFYLSDNLINPSKVFLHSPSAGQSSNLNLLDRKLLLSEEEVISAFLPGLPVHELPRPVLNRRLARLIARLLQERHELRASSPLEVLLPVLFRRGCIKGNALRATRGGLGRLRLAGGSREVDPLPHDLGAAGATPGADLTRGRDDVSRDDGDVLVAQCAQHGKAGIVRDAQLLVPRAGGFDELADVGRGGDVVEEPGVRAWHVLPHLLDEVVSRRRGSPAVALGLGRGRGRIRLFACGPVLDAQDDVEELDDGALGVATAAVLAVLPAAGIVDFVKDAVGQARLGHVLAPCQERPDAVVEDGRVAVLVHALQQRAQVIEALGKGAQAARHSGGVTLARGSDGRQHEGDNRSAAGLDGDGDEVEPRLVEGAGEGVEGGEVLEAVDALVDEQRLEVPQTQASRHGNGGRQSLAGAVTTPDVAVGHEGQQTVGSPPFCVVFQTDGREHGETVDDSPQPPTEDQGLQVGGDGFPLVVVWIRESRQGQDFRQKAIGRRNSIMG
ncbi:hypothetical protein VP1G_10829 [Cytospora mali]|uniref:Uncharacterized protein n=1 Tax=Cytospora mali TaxID=578113 RepID=A0A194UYG5_CYTMA|nr:hypothetical protein VP1G_10829 [Valsa mali var. pyri (nom. inval.)]